MKYLKVFTDFAGKMDLLGDAERGRLFTAMLEYASTGTEPELKGNEKFLWAAAKSDIDRQAESYTKRCVANRKNVTNRYESLRTVSKNYDSYQDKDKDKDKDKEKDNNPPKSPLKGGVEIPDELAESWSGFCEMRKKIKKPLTDRAGKMILNELDKLAPGDRRTQGKILDQSTKHCWRDVYPLKGDGSDTDNVFLQMLREEGGQ